MGSLSLPSVDRLGRRREGRKHRAVADLLGTAHRLIKLMINVCADLKSNLKMIFRHLIYKCRYFQTTRFNTSFPLKAIFTLAWHTSPFLRVGL
jgi:hypothetical protein